MRDVALCSIKNEDKLFKLFGINDDENLGEKSACSILAHLGFYVSKQIIENAGITFAITSNPHTGNGKLPNELINFGYALRSQYSIEEFDSGVFVSQNYDKIIAGGPKNQDFTIYANMDSIEALEQFINDLKIKLGIQSKKELPNILSNVKSLGYDSRISALKKMNTDIERQEIIEPKRVEQDEQR